VLGSTTGLVASSRAGTTRPPTKFRSTGRAGARERGSDNLASGWLRTEITGRGYKQEGYGPSAVLMTGLPGRLRPWQMISYFTIESVPEGPIGCGFS
jgi:hypothetical protein